MIQQEEGWILLFQFKDREAKVRVLFGGLWFYNNNMIVFADYDGISALDTVRLHLLEMWVGNHKTAN